MVVDPPNKHPLLRALLEYRPPPVPQDEAVEEEFEDDEDENYSDSEYEDHIPSDPEHSPPIAIIPEEPDDTQVVPDSQPPIQNIIVPRQLVHHVPNDIDDPEDVIQRQLHTGSRALMQCGIYSCVFFDNNEYEVDIYDNEGRFLPLLHPHLPDTEIRTEPMEIPQVLRERPSQLPRQGDQPEQNLAQQISEMANREEQQASQNQEIRNPQEKEDYPIIRNLLRQSNQPTRHQFPDVRNIGKGSQRPTKEQPSTSKKRYSDDDEISDVENISRPSTSTKKQPSAFMERCSSDDYDNDDNDKDDAVVPKIKSIKKSQDRIKDTEKVSEEQQKEKSPERKSHCIFEGKLLDEHGKHIQPHSPVREVPRNLPGPSRSVRFRDIPTPPSTSRDSGMYSSQRPRHHQQRQSEQPEGRTGTSARPFPDGSKYFTRIRDPVIRSETTVLDHIIHKRNTSGVTVETTRHRDGQFVRRPLFPETPNSKNVNASCGCLLHKCPRHVADTSYDQMIRDLFQRIKEWQQGLPGTSAEFYRTPMSPDSAAASTSGSQTGNGKKSVTKDAYSQASTEVHEKDSATFDEKSDSEKSMDTTDQLSEDVTNNDMITDTNPHEDSNKDSDFMEVSSDRIAREMTSFNLSNSEKEHSSDMLASSPVVSQKENTTVTSEEFSDEHQISENTKEAVVEKTPVTVVQLLEVSLGDIPLDNSDIDMIPTQECSQISDVLSTTLALFVEATEDASKAKTDSSVSEKQQHSTEIKKEIIRKKSADVKPGASCTDLDMVEKGSTDSGFLVYTDSSFDESIGSIQVQLDTSSTADSEVPSLIEDENTVNTLQTETADIDNVDTTLISESTQTTIDDISTEKVEEESNISVAGNLDSTIAKLIHSEELDLQNVLKCAKTPKEEPDVPCEEENSKAESLVKDVTTDPPTVVKHHEKTIVEPTKELSECIGTSTTKIKLSEAKIQSSKVGKYIGDKLKDVADIGEEEKQCHIDAAEDVFPEKENEAKNIPVAVIEVDKSVLKDAKLTTTFAKNVGLKTDKKSGDIKATTNVSESKEIQIKVNPSTEIPVFIGTSEDDFDNESKSNNINSATYKRSDLKITKHHGKTEEAQNVIKSVEESEAEITVSNVKSQDALDADEVQPEAASVKSSHDSEGHFFVEIDVKTPLNTLSEEEGDVLYDEETIVSSTKKIRTEKEQSSTGKRCDSSKFVSSDVNISTEKENPECSKPEDQEPKFRRSPVVTKDSKSEVSASELNSAATKGAKKEKQERLPSKKSKVKASSTDDVYEEAQVKREEEAEIKIPAIKRSSRKPNPESIQSPARSLRSRTQEASIKSKQSETPIGNTRKGSVSEKTADKPETERSKTQDASVKSKQSGTSAGSSHKGSLSGKTADKPETERFSTQEASSKSKQAATPAGRSTRKGSIQEKNADKPETERSRTQEASAKSRQVGTSATSSGMDSITETSEDRPESESQPKTQRQAPKSATNTPVRRRRTGDADAGKSKAKK